MKNMRVFIAGLGIISPLGLGRQATLGTLRRGASGIKPVSLFPVFQTEPLPVGEIGEIIDIKAVPRTHVLAMLAAREALAGINEPPDAILLGVTSGGMPGTETLLRQKNCDPALYRHHGVGSVASHIACSVGCQGPVLTVSTACSSGSVALAIAMEMLKSGKVRRVLAGGADALCRMTYYGFHALQLIDVAGARPLDRNRHGMSLGEGAAMLLLIAAETPPAGALGEMMGAGLSCDAYHAAAPQPEGLGAFQAMQHAIAGAGMNLREIDYIHLHGTGTMDNDLAEARALNTLFGSQLPLLSSTKGATGHTLGAAGAMGAVIAVMSICEGFVPANTGCHDPDPELKLRPVMKPLRKRIHRVLVNAFGFGGNNASLVIGHPDRYDGRHDSQETSPLLISSMACLTGAGNAQATMNRLMAGGSIKGVPDLEAQTAQLPQKMIRRLKRLPRMVLALAAAACAEREDLLPPQSIFFGTGWGPLSETHDFLSKLFESGEQFTSPTDFIGSVHNAPAGQAAIHFRAKGPNITLSGGDYSFEQALLTADLLRHESERPLLLIGADEYHPVFSPLFEPAAASKGTSADGGAAFILTRGNSDGSNIRSLHLAFAREDPHTISCMIEHLGGKQRIRERYSAIFAGIPAVYEESGRRQLNEFETLIGFEGPVIDYRRWTGEFASASAVAAFLAAKCIQQNEIPVQMRNRGICSLSDAGILLLGLGDFVTAVEVMP